MPAESPSCGGDKTVLGLKDAAMAYSAASVAAVNVPSAMASDISEGSTWGSGAGSGAGSSAGSSWGGGAGTAGRTAGRTAGGRVDFSDGGSAGGSAGRDLEGTGVGTESSSAGSSVSGASGGIAEAVPSGAGAMPYSKQLAVALVPFASAPPAAGAVGLQQDASPRWQMHLSSGALVRASASPVYLVDYDDMRVVPGLGDSLRAGGGVAAIEQAFGTQTDEGCGAENPFTAPAFAGLITAVQKRLQAMLPSTAESAVGGEAADVVTGRRTGAAQLLVDGSVAVADGSSFTSRSGTIGTAAMPAPSSSGAGAVAEAPGAEAAVQAVLSRLTTDAAKFQTALSALACDVQSVRTACEPQLVSTAAGAKLSRFAAASTSMAQMLKALALEAALQVLQRDDLTRRASAERESLSAASAGTDTAGARAGAGAGALHE